MPGSASTSPDVQAVHHDGHFEGSRGCRIFWQAWRPEGDPRAVVVLAHGASEHSGRYRYLVERLVPDGFAIYAVDHRGHGRSDGPRAFVDRLSNVVADFDQLVEMARGAHEGLPLFLVGHSFGGCVALAYALEHQDKLDAMVLTAPLAVVEAAPASLRMIARTLSVISPRAGVFEVDSSTISRDPAEVEAYDSDPLVYRGKLSARTVTEIADAIASFPDRLGKLRIPLLVMHGTHDRLVPLAGAKLVADLAGSEDKTLKLYEGFYHELFNEPAGEREKPLDELAEWLAARI